MFEGIYQLGFLDWQTLIISTERLKPINIPFDTGWNFVQYMFDNIILLFKIFWFIMRDTPKHMHVLVNNACTTTWDLLPKWNTTPLLHRRVKKQYKGSHGPENTHGILILARSLLTNAIVSQEDTTEYKEKFQLYDQLQYVVKHIRFCQQERSIDLLDPVL